MLAEGFLGEVTVNLTNSTGAEDVLFPSNFFPDILELNETVPVAYCAITGLISAINEQQSSVRRGSNPVCCWWWRWQR